MSGTVRKATAFASCMCQWCMCQVVTVVSVVTLFDVVVGVECVTWAGPETEA